MCQGRGRAVVLVDVLAGRQAPGKRTRASTWAIRLMMPLMVLSTGCVTTRSFAGLRTDYEQISTTASQLGALGAFPADSAMADDVRLVTFTFKVADAPEQRRDTLVGREAVAGWLALWSARQAPSEEFVFQPWDTRECDGAAVQSGTYRLRIGDAPDSPTENRPYHALWIPSPGGGWMLSRLWLDPDGEARVGRIARNCRSLRLASRELRRLRLDVEVASAWDPSSGAVTDAMHGAGWNYSFAGSAFPQTHVDPVGVSLGLLWRLTPDFGLQARAIQNPAATVTGRLSTDLREPSLRMANRVLAMLGVVDLGRVEIGLGPALALTSLHWEERFYLLSGADPVSERQTALGALAQVSVAVPVAAWIQPYISANYLWAGDAQIPGFEGLPGFSAPLRRGGIGLGAAISF